jgi:hypothetical protein
LTDYHTLLVTGVIRILVGCLVLFGLLPRLVLPGMFSDQPWRARAANFLASGALAVLSVHLLVLATMYDGVALVAVCLGMWAFRIWYSRTRESSHSFETLFAHLLRMLDIVSWNFFKERGRDWLKDLGQRFNFFQMLSLALLAAVIVGTGLVRLMPVWNHAAPFSVEYYETLEHIKRLQLNQMYGEGYRVPLGLPMLAQTLSLLSQVNVAIVLHFLGAVSSMMLAGSIAYVVYRATLSLQGSIVGAALFGLFNVFLPMDMRYQVEADSLVLASAFLLPSLSFLAEYCAEPRLRTLAITLAGLFCALTVNLFVGGMAFVGAFAVLVGALLHTFRLSWLRGSRLLVMVGVVAALLVGFYLVMRGMLDHDSFKNAMQVLMYDQHVNRYFSMYGSLPQFFVWLSVILFGVCVLLSAWKFSNTSIPLQLFSWGAFGFALLFLVQYNPDEMASVIPSSQIDFLLSITAAIAMGIAIGWGARLGDRVLMRLQARGWMENAWRLLVLGTALFAVWFYSPVQSVAFEYTVEPDGFAKSLYLIEQNYMPYQWTVVSHQGTALTGMNRGRFLDYGYFSSRYKAESYKQGTKEGVPTPVIFIFVERSREQSNVATELATGNSGAAEIIKDWLDAYQKTHNDLRIFYSDEEVVVYTIEDPAVNALRR